MREDRCAHAALHRVSPVVCKVYQTGMARQQHYLGHINPVADMSVFELDTHLNGYSRRQEEELLNSGIRLEHEFLSQWDEAEMGQRAHFGSEENMAVLKDLFEKVGHVLPHSHLTLTSLSPHSRLTLMSLSPHSHLPHSLVTLTLISLSPH